MYANLGPQIVRIGRHAISLATFVRAEFAPDGSAVTVHLLGESRALVIDEPGAVAEADRYFGPTAASRMAQVDAAYPRPHLPAREPA